MKSHELTAPGAVGGGHAQPAVVLELRICFEDRRRRWSGGASLLGSPHGRRAGPAPEHPAGLRLHRRRGRRHRLGGRRRTSGHGHVVPGSLCFLQVQQLVGHQIHRRLGLRRGSPLGLAHLRPGGRHGHRSARSRWHGGKRQVEVAIQRSGAGGRGPPGALWGRLATPDAQGLELRQLHPGLGGGGGQHEARALPVFAGALPDLRSDLQLRPLQAAIQAQRVGGGPACSGYEVVHHQPHIARRRRGSFDSHHHALAQLVVPGLPCRGGALGFRLEMLQVLDRRPQRPIGLGTLVQQERHSLISERQEVEAGLHRRRDRRLAFLGLGP